MQAMSEHKILSGLTEWYVLCNVQVIDYFFSQEKRKKYQLVIINMKPIETYVYKKEVHVFDKGSLIAETILQHSLTQ